MSKVLSPAAAPMFMVWGSISTAAVAGLPSMATSPNALLTAEGDMASVFNADDLQAIFAQPAP
ncbi:hypothetical protein IP91_04903 [Pseudoduganella lurida]|uniref:Uncharacterized protein n=1 Tax=Pseudoduganella lurida TaxID=1036180 RepID=A0A562QVS7_9BURK|nr:hypothetical protein IP91_04903 [Pseudoduganella lurida]